MSSLTSKDLEDLRFGVKYDFDYYNDLVNQDGYILFDDYKQKDWPEVVEFVDNEVKQNKNFKLIGTEWRSAVFQKLDNEKTCNEV